MPAFQKCIDNRVSAAELDVQMLGDGTIVVLHDDNLRRTTGVDKNVWEVTYDDIKDLDNGSFFDESYAGTTIPMLDDVMRLAGRGKNKLYLRSNATDMMTGSLKRSLRSSGKTTIWTTAM